MNTKRTKRSAIFSMIVSLIMLIAYTIVGYVYMVIVAFASLSDGNNFIKFAMNMVIILGIISMVLAIANIVISILTLKKIKTATTFDNIKSITLLLMILMYVQLGLNTIITAVVGIILKSVGMVFVHVPFVVFYLIFALSVTSNYRKNKKLNLETISNETVEINNEVNKENKTNNEQDVNNNSTNV